MKQENVLGLGVEKLVLNIINEYLEQNRTFEIAKILPIISSRFVKSSFSINTEGILRHLENLVSKKVIVEGSKFTKEKILSNQNRKMIYELITKNPGIHMTNLSQKLKMKPAIIEWHINVLLKFACIIKQKIENRNAYYNYHHHDFEKKEILRLLLSYCVKYCKLFPLLQKLSLYKLRKFITKFLPPITATNYSN